MRVSFPAPSDKNESCSLSLPGKKMPGDRQSPGRQEKLAAGLQAGEGFRHRCASVNGARGEWARVVENLDLIRRFDGDVGEAPAA